jgi:hypothetical protein
MPRPLHLELPRAKKKPKNRATTLFVMWKMSLFIRSMKPRL